MSYSVSNFDGLGIAPTILTLLDKLKFMVPTPIQHKAIPIGIEGKDLVGIAQTGTGKTLAFTIPMLQNLAKGPGGALVVVPTRELAMQVNETVKKIAPAFGMKSTVLIGGAPIFPQISSLKKGREIVIATPGRLIDHVERGTVHLKEYRILILDEADRMFDMGFAPQVTQIIKGTPREKQVMLFSATMPPSIMSMAGQYMSLPIHVEIAPTGTTAEGVSQELFIVKREYKSLLMKSLLDQYRGSALVFVRTKNSVKYLTHEVRAMGHRVAEIHSDRNLNQRREALEGFKRGKYRILVATDIASRGIDVSGIEIVINYDVPEDPENYIHRIGRTGRAGHVGHAITLATPDQRNDVKAIEKLIQSTIPLSKHPEVPGEEFAKPQKVFISRKFGGRRRPLRFPRR